MKTISIFYVFLCFCLCSCKESPKEQIARLVKEWEGKEVLIPTKIPFTRYGKDTIDYQLPCADYTIVAYIDSVGCTSCKLQFTRWEGIMHEIDSISNTPIPYLFIFHPKGEKGVSELTHLMKRDKFTHPVWIDKEDRFYNMNQLPENRIFHTLLVDRNHRVVAMGDPFQNPKVKELYINVLTGKLSNSDTNNIKTEIAVDKQEIDLGTFELNTSRKAVFTLHNKGKNSLVINDVTTSCRCITVEYPKQPIDAGKSAKVTAIYRADEKGHFNKALRVHSNTGSVLKLSVKGVVQ